MASAFRPCASHCITQRSAIPRGVLRCAPQLTRAPRRTSQLSAVSNKLSGRASTEPHLQLATAKLPSAADPVVFAEQMYQWAATITQNGGNLPLILPLKVDRLENGFQISLLKSMPAGGFDSAGDLSAVVEPVDGVGSVLFVRFFEGPATFAGAANPPPAGEQRLEVALNSLKDVDQLMATMPAAIRRSAALAGKRPDGIRADQI